MSNVLSFKRTDACTTVKEFRGEQWLLRWIFGFSASITAHSCVGYLVYIHHW